MKSIRTFLVLLLIILLISGCRPESHTGQELEGVQIAFMADVHLHDIYGKLQDNDYKGVLNPGNSKYVLARTMQSQLRSTRIFNENYFAFLAALDDVAKRNIKFVVLPGDFSDDGQPLNIRGLKEILDHYSTTYGIRFIATTGNHDPVNPYSQDAGKTDFFGKDGSCQAMMSREGMYIPKRQDHLPVVITKDIRTMGYGEIIESLGNFGFNPQKDDIYWETPFTNYCYESYHYQEAQIQSELEYRNYEIPPFGSKILDASYLVEPVKGLWFLAIDANVYVPNNIAQFEPNNPNGYKSASIGYSNVLTHKKHLIRWIEKVTREAKKQGKTLITFSHYPMVDFNDDATPHLKSLFGENKMQLHRVPEESVARIFANAGVRLHFGGHMHINDTGVRKTKKGNTLVNVQIPSLAAYIPAYKLLTIHQHQIMEVQTIVLDSVPRFNELFGLYEQEYNYLLSIGKKNIWDKNILSSKTYHEFTNRHLEELVQYRFIESDWPVEFRDFFLNSTGKDLLTYAVGNQLIDTNVSDSFSNWTGFDMIFDFYRLRSADKLALEDIGSNRIKQYQQIIESLLKTSRSDSDSEVYNDFLDFAKSFRHLLNGAPANHFKVDMQSGEIKEVPVRHVK